MKTDEFRLRLYGMFPEGNEYHIERKCVLWFGLSYWKTLSWLPMRWATCQRLIAEIRESEKIK